MIYLFKGIGAEKRTAKCEYNPRMTEMLDAAVAKLATLPAQEQDRIAQWLLQELPDEALWDSRFSQSQNTLSKLADEARRERDSGMATELNPDAL